MSFLILLGLTEPVIEEQISSQYSSISASKLTQFFFPFLFQICRVFHSTPYKGWMIAEGRSSFILIDFCISGDDCHPCWPFSHPALNIFINDWRVSQSKNRETVFSKHNCCCPPNCGCLDLGSSARTVPLIFYSPSLTMSMG